MGYCSLKQNHRILIRVLPLELPAWPILRTFQPTAHRCISPGADGYVVIGRISFLRRRLMPQPVCLWPRNAPLRTPRAVNLEWSSFLLVAARVHERGRCCDTRLSPRAIKKVQESVGFVFSAFSLPTVPAIDYMKCRRWRACLS